MISQDKYKNFVRAAEVPLVNQGATFVPRRYLSGQDASRIYLDVVKNSSSDSCEHTIVQANTSKRTIAQTNVHIKSDKQLFLAAQNDDHEALKSYLSLNPDKINIKDEYGWTLLMIACQANSVHTVKGLLRLGIDTSVRDKAGHSASSLLIKQKNVQLIDLMLNHKSKQEKRRTEVNRRKNEQYHCLECQNTYRDKKEHLSSTVHNINLSKGLKPRAWYGIPESNRGYQILLRSGWDRETGLGPEGLGKQHPIRAVMKQDRKGLGVARRKATGQSEREDIKKSKRKRNLESDYQRDKKIEINFRREFYDVHY